MLTNFSIQTVLFCQGEAQNIFLSVNFSSLPAKLNFNTIWGEGGTRNGVQMVAIKYEIHKKLPVVLIFFVPYLIRN